MIVAALEEPLAREEAGMSWTADVVLLIGGVAITVLLLAVFVPFMVRIWREDAPTRRARSGTDR